MPPPKDPLKYALYLERQRQSHLGQVSGFKDKKHTPEAIQQMKDSHKGQVSGFKDKKHTKETLEIMRLKKLGNNYRLNKKMTPEQIEQNRLSHLGQVPWMKGRTHTEESNQKNREKHIGKPSPRKNAILSEETKNLVRKARAKQIFPKEDTSIEKAMQNALTNEGISFEKQKLITNGINFFHRVDIFVEPNICINTDNEYWHSLPKAVARDKIVNEMLPKLGYIHLRFWQTQIENDIETCIKIIKTKIQEVDSK